MPKVRVLFIGIGHPVPTFIKNRILQLDKTGEVKVFVLTLWGSRVELKLSKGATLPELPIRFNLLQTIFPVFWQSLFFLPRAICLWRSLRGYSLKIRVRSFFKYNSLVRIRRIDLVHFQWLVPHDEISWAKRFFGRPVIISARGSQLTVYPATMPGYEDKVRQSLEAADYVYTVSQSMARVCTELGIGPDKIFVNYNGIDTARFIRSNKRVRNNNDLRLISTGTLLWRKGYMWQLLLVKRLTDKGLGVRLKIIGDGPDLQGLDYTIKRLGLGEVIKLEGRKSQDEIIKFLQESDLYISTSAAEGLSNSVLEAVACGLPVVAFDCEGMNEVIENGHNGFIIPFGDLASMQEKIQALRDDRKLMFSMGQNGSQIANERFDYRTHVQKMADFYKSISPGNE